VINVLEIYADLSISSKDFT